MSGRYGIDLVPIREVCPTCGGTGIEMDLEIERQRGFPEHPLWERCTRCMEAGYAPSRTHVREECPWCRGQGYHVDADIVEGWPEEDPKIACGECMGNGDRIRRLTLLEKLHWGLRLYWPPDVENPLYIPDPERAKWEHSERERRREAVGFYD